MWPLILGGTLVGGVAWALLRKSSPSPNAGTGPAVSPPKTPVAVIPGGAKRGINGGSALRKASLPGGDPFANAAAVSTPDGQLWLVAPTYIAPVSANDALRLAREAGGELPSPALVDAIWRAADLKIEPPTRAQNVVSQAVFDDQAAKVAALIAQGEEALGHPAALVAGTHKDLVMFGGHAQLYGWHVEDSKAAAFTARKGIPLHAAFTAGPGRIIQGPSGSVHSPDFLDYSQGLRLVRKAPTPAV